MEDSKPKLWIVGDSFSYLDNNDLNNDAWPLLLPRSLNWDSTNNSLKGTSQDWAWRIIRDWQFDIKPNDQLIIALTHPSRVWFFEDRPELANYNIVDLDVLLGDKERLLAVKYYVEQIQRPEIDIQATDHRMGWLSNLVYRNNWRKPIIIQGFAQTIYTDLYPNLIFSKGNLFTVNRKEEAKDFPSKNWDLRYNHMCLSNHKILVEKIINTINTGEELDLTTGFIENNYSKKLLEDKDLAAKELSTYRLEDYHKVDPIIPWTLRFKS